MANREISEDPIEAIKRRNEERSAKLREKLAAEGAGTFKTSINGAEEVVFADEFDLGAFPPPPDIKEVPISKILTTAKAIPGPVTPTPEVGRIKLPPVPDTAGVPTARIEMPPPGPALHIEITPVERAAGVSAPPPEPSVFADLGAEIVPPPDITEIPTLPDIATLMAELEISEEPEFPFPEAWEGALAAGPTVGEAIELPVIEGLELPEIPPIEVFEVGIGEPIETAALGVPLIELPEPPGIAEKKAELITGEPAPFIPEPAAPKAAPEIAAPAVEAPLAVEPTVVGEPLEEELAIKVGIEVKGTKVRITRENIALDGAVELLRKIVERYESR